MDTKVLIHVGGEEGEDGTEDRTQDGVGGQDGGSEDAGGRGRGLFDRGVRDWYDSTCKFISPSAIGLDRIALTSVKLDRASLTTSSGTFVNIDGTPIPW